MSESLVFLKDYFNSLLVWVTVFVDCVGGTLLETFWKWSTYYADVSSYGSSSLFGQLSDSAVG